MSSQNPPNPNVDAFNNQYWIQSTDQDSQTLQEVLIQGNSAGAKPINMNNNDITSIASATMTTLNSVGTATFSGIPTCTAVQPLANDTTTKMPTTSWVQTAITAGTSAKANNISGGNAGDLLYQSAVGITAKLPIGSNTYLLTSNGSVPTWVAPVVVSTPTLANVLLSGNSAGATDIDMNTRSITNATAMTALSFNGALNGASTSCSGNSATATNITLGNAGDLLYQSASNTTSKIGIGTNNQILTSNGSIPTWTTPAVVATPTLSQVLVSNNSAGSTDINMNSNSITTATNITGKYHQMRDITSPFGTNAQIYLNGANMYYDNGVNGGNHIFSTYTAGAVQKLPLSLSSTETTCGLPLNLNSNNITNGATITATTFTGALNGNAGSATLVNVSATIPAGVYNIPVCSSTGNQQLRADAILQYDTTVSPPVIVSNLNGRADTAINITGGSGGQVLYQSAVNTTSKLTNGTAGQVLQSNGTTIAPSWTSTVSALTSLTTPIIQNVNSGSAGITIRNQNGNSGDILIQNSSTSAGADIILNTTIAGSGGILFQPQNTLALTLGAGSIIPRSAINYANNGATALSGVFPSNVLTTPFISEFYLVDATAAVGITLPDADFLSTGMRITFRRSAGTSTITITALSGGNQMVPHNSITAGVNATMLSAVWTSTFFSNGTLWYQASY